MLKRVIEESQLVYGPPGPFYEPTDTIESSLCCLAQLLSKRQKPRTMDEFIWFQNRLNTFVDWPHQTPSEKAVAEAGFVYTRGRDVVKCVACDVELNEWGSEDCPWNEHRRFSPECSYLKMIKGATSMAGYQYEYKGRLNGEISIVATNPGTFPDYQSCKDAAKKHSFDVPCCMGVYLWMYRLDDSGRVVETFDVDNMMPKNKTFVNRVKSCIMKQ